MLFSPKSRILFWHPQKFSRFQPVEKRHAMIHNISVCSGKEHRSTHLKEGEQCSFYEILFREVDLEALFVRIISPRFSNAMQLGVDQAVQYKW